MRDLVRVRHLREAFSEIAAGRNREQQVKVWAHERMDAEVTMQPPPIARR